MKTEQKKFRLLEYLNNVPYSNRRQVKEELILIMDVSESTLDRIMYAKEGEKQDISATNLVRVANYFGVKPEDLFQPQKEMSIGNTQLVR